MLGETRRRSPQPSLGSCDFSCHACPSRRQRVLHGQRPMASALPSGAASLSNGPWGAPPHGRTTRCHRVVRKQCTRRCRVARKSAYAQLPGNIVPLDATEWHAHRALDATEWHGRALRTRRLQPRAPPRCVPQNLQRRLGQGDRTSERRPLTSHERAGQLVASPPAHSWGHPIPATEWVCVTHVLWRRTHTSMHEVSKGYLK